MSDEFTGASIDLDVDKNPDDQCGDATGAPRGWRDWLAISVCALAALAVLAAVIFGLRFAWHSLSAASAKAEANSVHIYTVTSQQRQTIVGLATTNESVKSLVDNGYSPVRFHRLHDRYDVEFRQCGDKSFTDCAEGSKPKKDRPWVRIRLAGVPTNENDIRLSETLPTIIVLDSHYNAPLTCASGTWKLTSATYADVSATFRAFYNLSYNYGNGMTQIARVGVNEWSCTVSIT